MSKELVRELQEQDWTRSAHSHPGSDGLSLMPSGVPGDRKVLLELRQERSMLVNAVGRGKVFSVDGMGEGDIPLKSKLAPVLKDRSQSRLGEMP